MTLSVCLFVIDNLSKSFICGEKSLFLDLFKLKPLSIGTKEGVVTQKQHVGALGLELHDDLGVKHTYDKPDVSMIPNLHIASYLSPF